MKFIENLPYRNAVSIITFVGDKLLLVDCASRSSPWWKIPQGGVEPGESLVDAARREFFEELGFDNLDVVGISSVENVYDWPIEIIERSDFSFRGQHQKFVIARIPESAIFNIDPLEINDFKLVSKEDFISIIHSSNYSFSYCKADVILKVFREFSIAI